MFEFFSDTDDFDAVMAQNALPGIEAIIADYDLDIQYLNFIFVNDEQLLDINKQFLEHDYYTDIITFNYAPEGGAIEGELYISIDRVKENAKDLGVNFELELLRVILHGVLHLAGMEDSTEAQRKAMQLLEDKYINITCSTWNMPKS